MTEQLGIGLPTERIGDIERALLRGGVRYVIGVDEVGRGPLAGPVSTAAVMLDLTALEWCDGLDDSKRLTSKRRAAWVPIIEARANACAYADAEPDEIDTKNILWASMAAMGRAVEMIACDTERDDMIVLVDGNRPIPGLTLPQRAIVKGDRRCFSIAAASILAKEHRDALMVHYDAQYPGYGFAKHKGYPTKLHMRALRELGPCAIHRRSFAPVRAALAASHHT